MTKANFGVVGMAVMGRNLALNVESRGYSVAIYNRSADKTEDVVASNPGKNLVPSYDVESFVQSIQTPRRIMLMVQAGPGTDATIQALLPHLDKGDILIDGGNTFSPYTGSVAGANMFLLVWEIQYAGCEKQTLIKGRNYAYLHRLNLI